MCQVFDGAAKRDLCCHLLTVLIFDWVSCNGNKQKKAFLGVFRKRNLTSTFQFCHVMSVCLSASPNNGALNIILGVLTKISIVPIKIFMAPLRNSSRGLVSHWSSDPRETSVDQTQSICWRSVRSDVSPISIEIIYVWHPARSSENLFLRPRK
jgi:hypothetical protein